MLLKFKASPSGYKLIFRKKDVKSNIQCGPPTLISLVQNLLGQEFMKCNVEDLYCAATVS